MSRKKILPFNPTQSPLRNTSLARQVARQNLTTLNNALWVTEHSYPLVKAAFPTITMPTGATAHGCYGSEKQWSSAVDEQHLWVRQHVLVSAASLLEVYLTTAISAAFWASPEYADRSLSGIKEVDLIKFGERAPMLDKLIQMRLRMMLKGQWKDRFRQMSISFGRLPARLDALVPRLQDLQDKRNRIAHGFGQNTRTFRRTPWEPSDAIELEVTDVEESLTCVNEVIREADIQVFVPLIGGYEFLYEYHLWFKGLVDPFTRPAPDVRAQAFGKHIAKKFGHGPNKKYYQSLIRYYDESN